MMPGFHGVSLVQSTVQVMIPFSVDVVDVSDIGRFTIFSVK